MAVLTVELLSDNWRIVEQVLGVDV
jgi:hypothetical protein